MSTILFGVGVYMVVGIACVIGVLIVIARKDVHGNRGAKPAPVKKAPRFTLPHKD